MHSKKIALIACGLIFCLSACGFKPLYVERTSDEKWYYKGEFDTSITEEMAKIKVEPIAERIGQMIRNDLIDSFTPQGVPTQPTYRLVVDNVQKQVVQQALRNDITATRERVRYTIKYRLYDVQTGKQLVSGNSLAYVGYDILANPYSTTFAQKKVEKNAARMLSDDVSLRIGAYFHSALTQNKNTDKK